MHGVLSLVAFEPSHFALLRSWFTSEREVVQWGGVLVHHPLDDAQLQAIVDLGRTDPPTRLSWMAAEGDALVGHIELGLDRDTASGLLARVGIAPGQRGRGLGSQLVGRALEVAWAIDWIEEVTLRVYTWNTPALALYRSLGFVTRNVAIQDRAVDGEHWEAATMALPRAA